MSYNELKQHGTEDFPIELYHIEKEHARYEMSAHWHSEIELIRVLSGSLNVRLNQEAYRVEAGGTIFVNPETLHQAYPEDCIYECLVTSFRRWMTIPKALWRASKIWNISCRLIKSILKIR